MKKIILNESQRAEIIKLYLEDNKSLENIAKECNISRQVVTRVLLEEKITLRKRTHQYKAKYDIFENIDSAEKAYWLGFLAADGCNFMRKHNATIIINLHQKDREHLEKFRQFCGATDVQIVDYISNAGFSNNTPMCRFALYSKKMANDLVALGIVPNKSLILNKPNISDKYYLPFILGYFDGDGSISKTAQNNNFCISFQGTKEMLEWINNILHISNKIEKRYLDNKNSYYIRCGGTIKPYRIMKTLYDSCENHLTRKYSIFKELKAVVLNSNV